MKKTRLKTILTLLLALCLIVLGLFWFAIIFILFALVYSLSFRYIFLNSNDFLRKLVAGTLLFFLLLSSTICVKLLVFDIYKIPSSSMENLLYPGDVIVVNKLNYGPKLPSSPFDIPVINLAFYMNKQARARIMEDWWGYSRWGGTTTVKQGDVFVFSSIGRKNFIMVKRCLGLPGDTLHLIKGEVYTNSTIYKSPKTVKNYTRFLVKDKKALAKIRDSLQIEGSLSYDSQFSNWANGKFSIEQLEVLKRIQCIDCIEKNIDTYPSLDYKLIQNTHSKWTLDDMGPIIIPKKGMILSLNPNTFMLYRKVMNKIEKSDVIEKNGRYFSNDKEITHYRFKQDYYFMMGDNRKESGDSRRWGFLPESHIIGKVQYILYSNKNNHFQWDRLFKAL